MQVNANAKYRRPGPEPGYQHWCGCSHTTRGVVVIMGGILVHLTLGSVYTFGNMSPYIVSYLRNRTSATSVRNVDALWITNIGGISNALGTSFGGIVERKLGPRVAISSGCFIYSLGVALTYFSVKSSLYLVGFTYGLMANLGVLWAYGPSVQTAVKWFPEKGSFTAGLILAGFGGGALIINQVITLFINQDNLSPDLKTSDGDKYFTQACVLDRVPQVFLLLAALYLGFGILGTIVIANPPKETPGVKQKHVESRLTESTDFVQSCEIYGSMTDTRELIPDNRPPPQKNVKTVLKELLTNRNSYVVGGVVCFFYMGMQFIISLYKAYGETFISDDHFLALIGSLSAICNSLGRPVWGYLMDKYGFQLTSKLYICFYVCFTATIPLCEQMGKASYLIWICLIYTCYCGVWPVSISAIGKLFGTENMAINLGFVMGSLCIAVIAAGLSAISLRDVIGWHGLFLMAAGLAVIAFFITFLFNGKDKEGKKI